MLRIDWGACVCVYSQVGSGKEWSRSTISYTTIVGGGGDQSVRDARTADTPYLDHHLPGQEYSSLGVSHDIYTTHGSGRGAPLDHIGRQHKTHVTLQI